LGYVGSQGAASISSVVTGTLTTAGWAANMQTVTVSGVTSSNNIMVSPTPASFNDWSTSGTYASAQNTNSITFYCGVTPLVNLSFTVLIFN
jgi:hypothetical protein